MASQLRVHSWHLNIGVGDGAIHLLVDETNGRLAAFDANPPQIVKAILIDGGDNEEAKDRIKAAIAKIESMYDLPAGSTNLQFDAIAITHWDIDHWYGVCRLLAEDMEAQINANAGYQQLINDSNLAWRKDIVPYAIARLAKVDADLLPAAVKAPQSDDDYRTSYTTLTTTQTQPKVLTAAEKSGMTPEQIAKAEATKPLLGPKEIVTYTDALITAKKGPWDLVASSFNQITVKSKYLKYAPNYPDSQFLRGSTPAADKKVDPITNDRLLTAFYVPHPCTLDRIGPPDGKMSKPFYFTSNKDNNYVIKRLRNAADTSNANSLTCNLTMNYKIDVPLIKKSKSSRGENISADAKNVQPVRPRQWKIVYCAKLAADFEDYLGIDMFYGNFGATGEWRTWTNPAELLKSANLISTQGPRMYIVAGDQVIVGRTPLAKAQLASKPTGGLLANLQKSPRPMERVIDTPSGSLGTRFNNGIRKQPDDRNSPSLVSIVLRSTVTDWSTVTAAQEQSSFQILYYTAGDALYDEEGAVAAWLHNKDEDWLVNPISAMKLSHHGAFASTPVSLLETLRPIVMVISNPDSYKFNHPTPEILFYLQANYIATVIESPDWRPPPLLCTNYPQYFDDTKALDMGLQAFRPTSTISAKFSAERQFVTSLLHLYTLAGVTDNLWTKLDAKCKAILLKMNTYKSLTDAEKKVLKDTITGLLAGETWAAISMTPNTLNIPEQPKAWITVVGAATHDDELEAHRHWRANDFVAQVYFKPEEMEEESLQQNDDLSANIEESSDDRLEIDDEDIDLGQNQAGGLPGKDTKKRDRDFKTEEPGSKAPTYQDPRQASEMENRDLNFPTNSEGDDQNSMAPEQSDAGNIGGNDLLAVRTQRANPGSSTRSFTSVLPSRSIQPKMNTAVAPPPTTFTVFSRRFKQANSTITASATQASLEPGNFDDFICRLPAGRVALVTALVTTSKAPNPVVPISVSPADSWMSWLMAGSFTISAMTMTGTVDTLARIQRVDASMSMFSYVLTFSTASTVAAVTDGSGSASGSSSVQAFLSQYHYLVLGLSSAVPLVPPQTGPIPTLKPSLADILTIAAPKWVKDLGSLPGFGPQLNFELDTGAGKRNLLICKPNGNMAKYLRLQFKVSNPDQLTASLGFMGTVSLTNTYLVIKKASTLQRTDPGKPSRRVTTHEIGIQTTVTATNGGKTVTFDAWFDFKADRTEFVLTFTSSGIFGDIAAWLMASCPTLNNSSIKIDDMLPKTNAINIHQISLCLANPGSSGRFASASVISASLFLEVDAFGAPFQVRLNWPQLKLAASLWTDTPPTDATYNLGMLPDYEPHTVIHPFGANLLGEIPLHSLLPTGTPDPPHGIQLAIYDAQFFVERTAASTISLSFSALIASEKPTSPSVPTIELGELSVSAKYIGAPSQDPNGSSYDILLTTEILLFPRLFDPSNPDFLAGRFYISVEVQDGSWTVVGEATFISFAAMYSLFDDNAQESVMDIMEQITIPSLRVEYDYSGGSSHLSVAGTLRVHTLDLDLAYDYDSGGTWTFTAQLHTIDSSPGTPGEITIADLIKDFDPQSELAEHLADAPFIGQIGIPSVSADEGAFEDAPVQLMLTKSNAGFVMWFRLEIDSPAGALSFLFVQYNAARGATDARSSPKRLIRVELNKLPKLPQIPIVGNIDQPVDSIDYVFVQDTAGVAAMKAGTAIGAGFTRPELDAINQALPSDIQVYFRDTQSSLPSGPSAGSNFVLLQGHHFMIKAEGKLVLDHVFGAANPPPTPPPSQQGLLAKKSSSSSSASRTQSAVVSRRNIQSAVVTPNDDLIKQDSGTTMGSHSKTLGPLTIHNVGVQVKDDHLFLIVDCTVLLGPIQFTLMGFGIGFPLKLDAPRTLSFNHLSELEVSDFKIVLAGLDIYFNAPPVLIAGYFEHKDDPTKESFRGGLTVGIKAYVLMAVGAYEHTKQPVDFKSVFLFGRLDGPLLSLEFIEISGVEVGFAYNYEIRSPSPGEVSNFPLVHGPSASNNPMDLITSDPTSATSFSNWQTTTQDKYWFAIGAKADSFQLVTADLAILFAFGKESLVISIIGIASAALPPVVGQKPREAFLYVELGIIGSLDVFGGSVTVGAQLTPNSYVLSPDCHLTGGFAMAYWFGPSPYAGDWVFTVGGYHPAFNPPTYYPNEPRVGISWSLGSHLSVTGEAFFAICPKACMGGGRLDARFSAGCVYANFTAYASFLVNFNKFFFIADMGFEVECGFEGDIGIIHFNVHAHIGADLHIQGPPFGGVVAIDLWIHKFKVYFGDQDNVPPPIPWSSFLDQVRKPGPGSTGDSQLIICAYVAGAATGNKQDPKTETTPRETGDKWWVRAGSFQFRVECKFPMDRMTYGDGTATTTTALTTNPIYGRLMNANDGQLDSTVTVTIVNEDDTTPFTSVAADKNNQFIVTPVFKDLPKALWQQYDSSQDPVQAGNSIEDILSSTVPSTISHLVGFIFESPDPKLPDFKLPVFNAAAAMEEGVFQDGVNPKPRQDAHPVVPPGDVDERPVLHPTAPVQTSDLPAAKDSVTPDKNWTALQSAWISVDDTIVQAVADTMTSLFGWSTPSTQTVPDSTTTPGALPAAPPATPPAPVGVAGLPPRNLLGQKPGQVVIKLDQYYLDPPCVTVA